MITVGLTGGIATGKSTVAELLRQALAVPVVDADVVAREVVAPGTPGLAAVAAAFGDAVLLADGGLDRKALGARVMGDADARKRLEAILHPLIAVGVLERLRALASAGAAVAVVEAALMVETGSSRLYDHLIVVSCSPETQRTRLRDREGFDPDQAERWIAAQMPLAQKEAVADLVIRNDGDLGSLRSAVLEGWASLGLPAGGGEVSA